MQYLRSNDIKGLELRQRNGKKEVFPRGNLPDRRSPRKEVVPRARSEASPLPAFAPSLRVLGCFTANYRQCACCAGACCLPWRCPSPCSRTSSRRQAPPAENPVPRCSRHPVPFSGADPDVATSSCPHPGPSARSSRPRRWRGSPGGRHGTRPPCLW